MAGKIYTRLSRDEVGQTSTQDQERECRALAARLGIDNIEIFGEDPGTSAFKNVPRPVFDRLMASLEPGDVVLAWAIDRVTRHGMEEAGKVLRLLEESGARLVTVSDGVDTNADASELNTGLRAIMAREYSKGLSKNVKRGKASGAVAGKWAGGQRWYGYTADPDGVWRGPKAIDIPEAKVLHEIRERYVCGERMLHIATDLNSRGITTVQGTQWRSENMLRLILNKRYIGVRTYEGAEYVAQWPAIFTEAQHLEIAAHRTREERTKTWPKGPTGTRSALLTGFVYCGNCGSKMVSKRRGGPDGRRRYTCRKYDNRGQIVGCGKLVRGAEPLEMLIVEELMFKLDTPDLAALLAPAEDKGKVDELITMQTTLKQRLEELHRDYYGEADDSVRISRAIFVRQKTDLEARLARVEQDVANVINSRAPIHIEVGQTIKQAWEKGSLDWRRRLLDVAGLEKVIIKPSRPGSATWRGFRFIPEDTERVWRY